jgi:hypothetical protein
VSSSILRQAFELACLRTGRTVTRHRAEFPSSHEEDMRQAGTGERCGQALRVLGNQQLLSGMNQVWITPNYRSILFINGLPKPVVSVVKDGEF